MLSLAALVGGALRHHGLGPNAQEMRSFNAVRGGDLGGDARLLLAVDPADAQEKTFVKDPAVVQLRDGSYRMVYSTVIP